MMATVRWAGSTETVTGAPGGEYLTTLSRRVLIASDTAAVSASTAAGLSSAGFRRRLPPVTPVGACLPRARAKGTNMPGPLLGMSKSFTSFTTVVGAVCAYFIIRLCFFIDLSTRTVRSDVIQGILIGFGLAFVSARVYARLKASNVNGWVTMFGLGVPGNGMFLRAAHAQLFPGPVTVPQEAMYWWANADGAGRTLTGARAYVMHFPPGRLPPNDAFWSLTMGTAKNRFVPNPIERYSVSDRSGLVPNADGSVDIYLQHDAPAGHESNWLPAPTGDFILWFRVYMPGAAILEGEYTVPPVVEAGR
jgi:hypothetical protein